MILFADQNLDQERYNDIPVDVTWETCTLRTWLNEEFYQDAFSTEEQDAIVVAADKAGNTARVTIKGKKK